MTILATSRDDAPRVLAALLILVVSVICLGLSPLSGQDVPAPNRGGFTESMGVPPSWRWSLGFSARTHRQPDQDAQVGLYGFGGFYKDIMNPMTAGLGVIGEGYFGQRGAFDGFIGGLDGGVRLGLSSPVARLAFGWDYNVPDNEVDFFLSLIHPLKRGGIFVRGGTLRIDYLPGRNHSAGIGDRGTFSNGSS